MNIDTRRITILGGIHQGFHWFSVGLLIPVIALLQIEKGLSLLEVGYNAAVYSIIVLALELPTGGLADTIGRKRVYILSRIFQIVTGGILLVANGFPLVMAAFITMGISRALSSGSMDAYFIDALESAGKGEDLQRPLALMGMFAPAGIAAGSLLGGWLPMSRGPIMVRFGFGDMYSANIAVALLCSIIQLIFTAVVIHEERHHSEPTEHIDGFARFKNIIINGLGEGFRNRKLFLLLAATLTWGLAFSGLEQFWQPRVKGLLPDMENTMIFGFLSTGYFAVGAIGNLFSIPLSKLLGNRHSRTMIMLRLLMGGLFILLSRTAGIAGFSVFYLLTFFANGVSDSPHAAMFNKIVPAGKRATLLSLESLFLQAGGAVGSLYAGFVAQTWSIGTAWLIGGGVIMISSLLYIPFAAGAPAKEAVA